MFENESKLVIQVGVLEGSLQGELTVACSITDSTAVGMSIIIINKSNL